MLLSFLLLFLATKTHFCTAADTISASQSLIPNQTLISKDGNFELGFFQPGTSLNSYIGIWYKKVSVENKTVVWVANRDTPLTDLASSELKLLEDGNLVLLSQSKVRVWWTNTTSSAMNSSEVVLGVDGNLVLRNRVRPSDVSWQSFDYPTDTWLPGGKIRYDNRTKTAQLLTSWKNENDPGTGLFSLELDPIGDQYVILWNRTQRYWTSGQWNGQIFSGVPEMRLNYIYNFSYTKNANESYFTYSLYNTSIVSRFVMDVAGKITQTSWAESTQNWFLFWSQPRQQCDVYAFCGAFGICNQNLPSCTCLDGFKPRTPKEWSIRDYSGGCVRNTSLQCGKDDFSPLQNVKLPANQPLAVPSDSSADECKSACLNNCSCSAYAYSRGCSVWNGDLLSLQKAPDGDGSGIDLYLRLAASDINFSMGKKPLKAYIIVLIAGSSFISILACAFLAYKMKQRGKTRYEGREISLSDLSKTHEVERGGKVPRKERKMSCGYTTSSLFLHFLIMMCTLEGGGRVIAGGHWKEETSHDHENHQAHHMKDSRDDYLLRYQNEGLQQLHPVDNDDSAKLKSLHQHRNDDGASHAIYDEVFKEKLALRLHSMDGDGLDGDLHMDTKHSDDSHERGHGHNHVEMSHMGHMDPALNVFLIEEDLKVGNIMAIYFPRRNPSSSPHFLPKEEADSIPFSSDRLSYLLHIFSFSNGSPQFIAMEDTLRQCELPPIEGETKLCATSLESMLDFTRAIFGIGTNFKVLTTNHHRKSTTPSLINSHLHNYTILNISREISTTKMVACHTMPYPYTIFYCHHQESQSKVYKVSLMGEYDERVEAVVVCHIDTSAWDPGHVSFVMLGIKPGTDPVCHFFPEDHLVWVPSV